MARPIPHESATILPCAEERSPAWLIRAILSRRDDEFEYAQAKFDLDAIIDPTLNLLSARDEIEGLANRARDLPDIRPTAPSGLPPCVH